jgi:hypothetical protein
LILGRNVISSSYQILLEIHQPDRWPWRWRSCCVFGKGCWFLLLAKWEKAASALGVDWTCSPRNARYLLVEILQL